MQIGDEQEVADVHLKLFEVDHKEKRDKHQEEDFTTFRRVARRLGCTKMRQRDRWVKHLRATEQAFANARFARGPVPHDEKYFEDASFVGGRRGLMASKRNAYLDRLCEFVGVVDPARAIQALVGRYQEAGRGLRSIAASLGVARIVEEPMSVDGAVLVDGEHGLTIKINSRCGAERRKFTLAHEVAHLLLSELVHGQAPCRRGRPLEDGATR